MTPADVVVGGVAWYDVLSTAADQAVAALVRLDVEEWATARGWGADGTISSGADIASEDAALGYLADAVPGATVCSEEAGVTGTGDVLLIVDPVDGTNNAVRGIPYWAFCVGVVISGVPAGAFIRNVPAREDFFAWVDRGVWWKGRPVAVRSTQRLTDAVLATQRPASPAAFGRWRDVNAHAKLARQLGAAALDCAYVGAGVLDAYVNVNTEADLPFGEKVVDYAAGAIFTGVAGGVATDVHGADLSFVPDLAARTPVLLAATPQLHGALLELVGG